MYSFSLVNNKNEKIVGQKHVVEVIIAYPFYLVFSNKSQLKKLEY